MPFWKRKKKEDEVPIDFFDTFRDRQPEQGYWYRGFKLNQEQWDRLVDKMQKGYKVQQMRNRDIFEETFTSNLDETGMRDLDFSPWPVPADGPGLPAPMGTVMSDAAKQHILDQSGWRASGATMNEQLSMMPLSTGTQISPWAIPTRVYHEDVDVDKLWEKMYAHMRKVIVVCSYCNRPTVISEGNCPKCGAPLPVEFL